MTQNSNSFRRLLNAIGGESTVALCMSLTADGDVQRMVAGDPDATARIAAVPDRALDIVRQRRYAQPSGGTGNPRKRLGELLRMVAEEPEGNRNNTLLFAGCRAAEMAADGEIDGDRVWELLAEAATAAGLGADETYATLRSAWATVRRAA